MISQSQPLTTPAEQGTAAVRLIGTGIGVAFLMLLAVYVYRKSVDRRRVSLSGSDGSTPSASASAGLSLVALGGLVAVLGTLLPWVKVAFGPAHASARAFGTSTGLFVLVLGGLLFARGVINARGSEGMRIGASVVALIAGGILAFLTISMMLSFKTRGIQVILREAATFVSQDRQVNAGQVQAILQQLVDQGILKLTMGLGIYVSAGGALLSIVGAAWNVSQRAPSAPPTRVQSLGDMPPWAPAMAQDAWDPVLATTAAARPAGGFSYGSGPQAPTAPAPAREFSHGSGPVAPGPTATPSRQFSYGSGPQPPAAAATPSRQFSYGSGPAAPAAPATTPGEVSYGPGPPPAPAAPAAPAPPVPPPPPRRSAEDGGGFDLGDSWSAGPAERRSRAGRGKGKA